MGDHHRNPQAINHRAPAPPMPSLLLKAETKLLLQPKPGIRLVPAGSLVVQDGKTFMMHGPDQFEELADGSYVTDRDNVRDVEDKLDAVFVLMGAMAEPSVVSPSGQVSGGTIGVMEQQRIDFREFKRRCRAAADGVPVPDFMTHPEPWSPPIGPESS